MYGLPHEPSPRLCAGGDAVPDLRVPFDWAQGRLWRLCVRASFVVAAGHGGYRQPPIAQ